MREETDRIARHAARLLHENRVRTISSAIHAARDAESIENVPLPGRGQVRRHLAAMRMQSLGSEGYMQLQKDMLIAIDECLARLSWEAGDIEWRITGRAAEARFDGSDAVHIRFLASIDDPTMCDLLEQQGFEVTRVGSRMSRHGRLNEINAESGVLDIVLLRCPDRSRLLDPLNLVTGRPIPMLDGPLLATRIETRKDSG
ncbi:MAG: hypothetical protein VX908_01630 [Planctomycetota bacterium]|nr:hypothetical protein [Planctomycetota bacterium]